VLHFQMLGAGLLQKRGTMNINRMLLIIGLILVSSHIPVGSDDRTEAPINLIIKDNSPATITKMRGGTDKTTTYRVCDRDKCSYFTARKYSDKTQFIYPNKYPKAGSDDKTDEPLNLIIKDNSPATITKMRGGTDKTKTYRVCDRDKCSYFTARKYSDKTQAIYPDEYTGYTEEKR